MVKDQKSTQLMYSKAVEAAATRIKPSFCESTEVEVQLSVTNQVYLEYVNAEFTALKYQVERSGGNVPFDFATFQKYCNTFIVSRVKWVNRKVNYDLIIHPNDKVLNPSLLDNVCKNIGEAMETKLGLILIPTLPDGIEVLTLQEVKKISLFLASIEGYIGGLGYLKDKSGAWSFMSMQLVSDAIMNVDDQAHPAYSVLAAIVTPIWLKAALVPRVKYGDLSFYQGLVWELTSI
jgi:hypothetical protein